MSKALDKTDHHIVQILESDARRSLADIGKEVGLSGPAVGERLRALVENGFIRSFSAQLDLRRFGFTIQALVRIKPRSGQLHTVEKMIEDQPQIVTCDRVTGDDCYVARLVLRDISELDDVLVPFHDRAETHTSIIKSSLVEGRLPPFGNPSCSLNRSVSRLPRWACCGDHACIMGGLSNSSETVKN